MDENRAEGAPGKAEGVEGDARKLAGKAEGAIGGVTGGTKMRVERWAHEVAVGGQQKSIKAKDTSGEDADISSDEFARL